MGSGTKRQPLDRARAYAVYLEQRVDRIESEEIRNLCRELADKINHGVEMLEITKLMTFLNLVVRELEKKAKRRPEKLPKKCYNKVLD